MRVSYEGTYLKQIFFFLDLYTQTFILNPKHIYPPQGVTKLEFITEDYHFPGAYNTDGKVILEKGAPVSNELHQTEEQKERACS